MPCNQLRYPLDYEKLASSQCQVSHCAWRPFHFFKLRDAPVLYLVNFSVWVISSSLLIKQIRVSLNVYVFERRRVCDVACEVQWLCDNKKSVVKGYCRVETMCMGMRC